MRLRNISLNNNFQTLYNKKFLKTKIISYSDFHDKEMPKTGFNHICLAVITIDSVPKKDDYYHQQAFLEERK